MHLTQKHLKRIAIGALVATFIIRLATVTSLLSIYNCAGSAAACSGLHQADVKVHIGSVLQSVSTAIFVVSLLMLLYLWVTKKERF